MQGARFIPTLKGWGLLYPLTPRDKRPFNILEMLIYGLRRSISYGVDQPGCMVDDSDYIRAKAIASLNELQ